MDLVAHVSPYEFVTGLVIILGCGAPIGLGVVALGIYWLVGSARVLFGGKTAMGRVVRVDVSFGGEPGGKTYTPVVAFTEEREGRTVEVEFAMGSSIPPQRYRVGRKVRVVYLPDKPEVARVRSFWQMWGSGVLMILVGLGACAIVAALLVSLFR